MALNSRMRLRRSASSSVVWVRSPVKTTKSGAEGSALTAATACRSVLAASGLGGPLKPQCESESWTKRKSSSCPLHGVQTKHQVAFIASHTTWRGESALAANELDELLQFGLVEVGNGPVMHAVLCPAVRAVPAPREAPERLVTGPLARPDEEVHDVLRAPVDERCRRHVLDVIEPAARQRIALGGPVRHRHRVVELSLEPGLDGVLIGGGDIREMVGEQRPDMRRNHCISD